MCSLTLEKLIFEEKNSHWRKSGHSRWKKIQRLTFEKSAHIGRKNSHWTKYGFTHIEEISQLTLERAIQNITILNTLV